jgi:hypothetical protein
MKKFSLRDLFWLVLVVAILCAWRLSFRKQASEIGRLKKVASILELERTFRETEITRTEILAPQADSKPEDSP